MLRPLSKRREREIRKWAGMDVDDLEGDLANGGHCIVDIQDMVRDLLDELALLRLPKTVDVVVPEAVSMKGISMPPSHHTQCGWKSCKGGEECFRRFR